MASRNSREVAALNSWYADWEGLRVAVLGLGVTGFAVADTLCELGAQVQVIAGKQDPDREKLLSVIGAQFFVGSEEEMLTALKQYAPELIIISPGFRADNPFDAWAREHEIPVWGDIELAWRVRDKVKPADWICITGTNGKTTTTQLTAHMFLAAGYRVAPVGNIGVPVLDAIRDPQGFDVLVVELSSFQLSRINEVAPYASVCLNIAADHVDWHGSFEQYVLDKANVFERTQIACVYNRADENTLKMVENADVQEGARAISFGLDTPPISGLGIVEDLLADRGFHEERSSSALELMTFAELEKRGLLQPHMLENILAASALARSYGIAPEIIAQAVLSFEPDKHRAQLITEADGVRWVDDSKATNAHAADASLRASESVVWILGGLLKGVDLSELILKHLARLRAVVLIGKDRSTLVSAFKKLAPELPLVEVVDLDGAEVMLRAVSEAQKLAVQGDTVLLAPAAASMDQFAGYADRGEKFQAAVHKLVEGN